MSDLNAYTVSGCTKAVSGRALRVTRTAATPYIQSPAGKAELGKGARYVWLRLVKITGAAPAAQSFTVKWARSGTGAHGISNTYRNTLAVPAGKVVGDTIDLVFDMWAPTAGGTDWLDGTVDQWRLEFPDEVGSVWDVYLITPANRGSTRNTGALAGDNPLVITSLVNPRDITKFSSDAGGSTILLPKKNLVPPANWVLIHTVTLTLSGYGDVLVDWTGTIDFNNNDFAYISLLIDTSPTFDGAGVINNWNQQLMVKAASSGPQLSQGFKHVATGFGAGSHTFAVYGQQDNNASQHGVRDHRLFIFEGKA